MSSEILSRAIAKARMLSPADQDRLGLDLDARVDELQALRAELAAGMRSLDAGLGRELDMKAVIRRARAEHGEP